MYSTLFAQTVKTFSPQVKFGLWIYSNYMLIWVHGWTN